MACFPLVALSAPHADIIHPVRKAVVAFPVEVSGDLSSAVPLDRIDLLLLNEAGEYWNGTEFQAAWVPVVATVSGNKWQYLFSANVDDNFSIRVRAWDIDGVKQTVASYSSFSAVSKAQPVAEVAFPQRHETVILPVSILGSVTSPQYLERIELVIKNADNHFWNGLNYQQGWSSVLASVTGTGWSYEFAPVEGSKISVRAKAVATDGTRQSPRDYQSFSVELADSEEPQARISKPLTQTTVQYPLVINGHAIDNVAVFAVNLVIRDLETRQYWNGSTFQQAWVEVSAELNQSQWTYQIDGVEDQRLFIKARALDTAGNRQSSASYIVVDVLSCSHFVKGTATPANSGTPIVIDTDLISHTTGTVISANFFNSGSIVDNTGRTVSICVTESDASGGRRAQIETDVGQTDNTAIKAYPEFVIGSKFGLVGETSYRPYPLLVSSTGFNYPDLESIAGLVGLPARTSNLPDINITVNIDEQNVVGAERDVMLESWFYDISANEALLGTDAAGSPLVNTLHNVVGDGHPNPDLVNLILEMMVHVGALSPNDVSQANRNPSQHRLTDLPIAIGDYYYHIWYGDTHLAPLVVYSRETNSDGFPLMDLSDEGDIELNWNLFLHFTLNDLETLLARKGVNWAIGESSIFPTLRSSGVVGALEFGVEPQVNNSEDLPYRATVNKFDVIIDGLQFGFK